jgi:hypothetical protein
MDSYPGATWLQPQSSHNPEIGQHTHHDPRTSTTDEWKDRGGSTNGLGGSQSGLDMDFGMSGLGDISGELISRSDTPKFCKTKGVVICQQPLHQQPHRNPSTPSHRTSRAATMDKPQRPTSTQRWISTPVGPNQTRFPCRHILA